MNGSMWWALAGVRLSVALLALLGLNVSAVAGDQPSVAPEELRVRYLPDAGDAVHIHDRIRRQYDFFHRRDAGEDEVAATHTTAQELAFVQKFNRVDSEGKPLQYARQYLHLKEGEDAASRTYRPTGVVLFSLDALSDSRVTYSSSGPDPLPAFLSEFLRLEDRAPEHALQGVLPPIPPVRRTSPFVPVHRGTLRSPSRVRRISVPLGPSTSSPRSRGRCGGSPRLLMEGSRRRSKPVTHYCCRNSASCPTA